MRVLLSNKFYYRRGGDCISTMNTEQLLKANGHEVAIFSMQHPKTLPTPWAKYFPSEVTFKPGLGLFESFMRPFGSNEVKKKFTALLDEFKPDVLHMNNIHSQLSPIIGEIAHKRGVKVVWTLRDYKLLCPRYDCIQGDNFKCEECFTDKRNVLKHKCMKNSTLGSIIAYREAMMWSRERLESFVDAFIGPSQFMTDKLAQGGFNPKKLYTLCNFVDAKKCVKGTYDREDYYCFIGRVSHEKGIKTLIEAACELPYKLKIIGEGPLEDELKEFAKEFKNIEFVGYQQWEGIKEIVGNARFSVIPSEWYENNPRSTIEAQCLGTPVLGANIGGIPELIKVGFSGMVYESGNKEELRTRIEEMFAHKFDYEAIAKNAFEVYSTGVHYKKLMQIYNGEI